MFKKMTGFFGAIVLVASLGAGNALGAPAFDIFGPLPEATFGGSGIPNDNVAITNITTGVEGFETFITLGVSATRRHSNPALTNDGAGTFFAGGGSNFGGMGQSSFLGALWNFDFFVKVVGHAPASDFDFKLLYDFDPLTGTADADLGIWDLNSFISAVNPAQTSQNLLFGFLANSLIPEITAPAGSFDPNAGGEYSFALLASQRGDPLGRSAIDVNVSAVPVPAALPLFGTGLFVMGFVGWRRRKAAAKVAA